MTNRYAYSVIAGLILVLSALFLYFQYAKPIKKEPYLKQATEYNTVSVIGPIQPIPTIKTIDKDWLKLGKALFNSTLLSKDNTISCASCHLINEGGDDGFPVSIGVGGAVGERNSPTILNAVFNFRQFWDGRGADLAEQTIGPIHNPVEMDTNFVDIISKLKQSPEFVSAFNIINSEGITQEAIIEAIVTFEESLITPNAPIDLYLKGDDSALTSQQKRGYEKFLAFGCVACHQGRNIGGNLYQRIGRISSVPTKLLNDTGRFSVTKNPDDKYVFKVPSLRNIKQTGPYFHNGSVATLKEAIRIMAKGQLGIDLEEQDIQDLLALFDAFNGQLPAGSL